MPHVRSVTVGVWLTRGSRHETDQESGVAHFVEHMLFKGTTSRTARDIAQTIDSIGGQLDAFTAKEYASYYVKVLDEHLAVALDLLSDMIMRPALAPADVTKEQGVILEEIKMVEDAPDDLVHEIFAQQFWAKHPLGRPILGTPETVGSFASDGLRKYFDPHVRRAKCHRRRRRPPRARALPRSGRSIVCGPGIGSARGAHGSAGDYTRRGGATEGHRAKPLVHRQPRVSAGSCRPLRAVPAQHDPRRVDELAPLPAHSRGARAGVRRLQQPHVLQRHWDNDDLCGLRG